MAQHDSSDILMSDSLPALFRPCLSGGSLWTRLMELYEDNYTLMRRVCGGELSNLPERWVSRANEISLALTATHVSPYTTDIVYALDLRGPTFRVDARLYHDAHLCEVSTLWTSRQRDRSGCAAFTSSDFIDKKRKRAFSASKSIDQQWKDNLSFRRWLEYALSCGHFSERRLNIIGALSGMVKSP